MDIAKSGDIKIGFGNEMLSGHNYDWREARILFVPQNQSLAFENYMRGFHVSFDCVV